MGIRSMRRACATALVCACSLAPPVFAATYIVKTSKQGGDQSFEEANDPQLLDLGEGNGTSLEVKTVAGTTRLVLLFNAECTVAGLDNNDWLRIEILVDGFVAPPSGGSHAFCTSDGDGLFDNWVTAASDASIEVGPGTHAVEVRGSLSGTGVAGLDWRIGDLSLIVIAREQ